MLNIQRVRDPLVEDTDKLVERMRGFEADHEPDGWPAIRMRDVSALCAEIERLQKLITLP